MQGERILPYYIYHLPARDDIYLRNAINMLYKVVRTLFYEIQVTYNPKYEKWKDRFSESVFELLYKKNYDVAEHLYFILSSCTPMDKRQNENPLELKNDFNFEDMCDLYEQSLYTCEGIFVSGK